LVYFIFKMPVSFERQKDLGQIFKSQVDFDQFWQHISPFYVLKIKGLDDW